VVGDESGDDEDDERAYSDAAEAVGYVVSLLSHAKCLHIVLCLAAQTGNKPGDIGMLHVAYYGKPFSHLIDICRYL